MVICFGFIFVLIIPNIKEYRVKKSEYRNEFALFEKAQKRYKEKRGELSRLKSENLKILVNFTNSFSEEKFLKYCEKFFSNVSLKKTGSKNHKKNFILYELNVSSRLSTPTNFYNFLDSLNRYENIIETDFPIELKAKNNLISATFKIKVYELNSSR